jgi:DNA-binding response OmpR family regulator
MDKLMTERILLIDDDADILEMLEVALTDAGFLVQAFDNTGDVFQTIAMHQPDLILIDYLLHGINGGEICVQVKRSKKTSHIPVFLMTAYPRVLLSLGTYNCDEFIEKPFDLDHLIKRIRHHLDQPGELRFSSSQT